MDTLKNKNYNKFDYLSRYSETPFYFDTLRRRDVYGIGNPINKDIPFVSHKLKEGDTLDSLSLKYYGNPTFWWAIAYFNDIADPLQSLLEQFTIIKVPSISSIKFDGGR